MFKGKKKVKSKEDDNQKTFNTLAEKVIIILKGKLFHKRHTQ